jgi:hypothetical protein
MRKILGHGIIAFIFIFIFVMTVITCGLNVAVLSFITTFVLIGLIGVAVHLIN